MYRTEAEMLLEIDSIKRCGELVLSMEPEIQDFFKNVRHIWFIGSGSSFCIAKSAASMMTLRCGIPSFAVAAGDILLHTERYLSALENSAAVFITRSGMTTEVVSTLCKLSCVPGIKTVSICANKEADLNNLCDLSICVPWAFDESVCQTRTVGSFYSCIAMICAILSDDERLKSELLSLGGMGKRLNESVIPLAELIAPCDWNHVVVLADAEASGLMEEGALAFREICCKNANFYNLLDVRHGPIVMIDEHTLVFALLEGTSEIELSLMYDLKAAGAYLLSAGSFENGSCDVDHIAFPGLTDPIVLAIAALYTLQHIALNKAKCAGLNPDVPKGLKAWVAL